MKKYLLCLDGDATSEMCFNYDTMLDNLIYLLQSYGIEDADILEKIIEDTTATIKEVE